MPKVHLLSGELRKMSDEDAWFFSKHHHVERLEGEPYMMSIIEPGDICVDGSQLQVSRIEKETPISGMIQVVDVALATSASS